jgi:cytochrome b561
MTDTPTTPHERVVHARHGYSSLQITYHWSIVVLVAVNWLVGQGMSEVYEKREAGEAFAQWGPAFVHIALGIAILGTMIARLMKTLAWINHWAFYAVLISMPLLGAMAWFLAWDWAAALHSLLAWILPLLILVHVGGAVVHLFLGENVFRRMLRGTAGT